MTVTETRAFPAVSLTIAHTGTSARSNELGMRPMQALAYSHRGEQYLLIKSPPASGKSRGADVHRARQAPQPGRSPSHHPSCRSAPSAAALPMSLSVNMASSGIGRSSRTGTCVTRQAQTM